MNVGALFSFHYYGNTDLSAVIDALPERPEVFIDSGGFSAFTQGVAVEHGEYARWVRRHRRVIDHVANLDVIGDPSGTMRSHLRMESLGVRDLMPVLHLGCDPDWLSRYADRGVRYACLGGMVPKLGEISAAVKSGSTTEHTTWLDRMHERAAGLGVDLHGFGIMAWEVVLRWPWRSTDSSSWNGGLRFGTVRFFDEDDERWVSVKLRDRALMRYAGVIRSYGVDPIELVRDGSDFHEMVVRLQSRSWATACHRHKEAGRLRSDYQIYLVDGAVRTMACAMRACAGWSR